MDTPMANLACYAEIQALHAILCDDEAEAGRILGEMLPGERVTFYGQLDRLCTMARWAAEHPQENPIPILSLLPRVEPVVIDHTPRGAGR